MRSLIVLALVLMGFAYPNQSHAACGKVTIAEMTWGSAAVAAHVYKQILESGYGCEVELVPGDTVPTTTSMAEKGEPDLAPEVWMNSTREVIERGVREGRLRIAGKILKDGGEEGWWVPDYFLAEHPELTTLQAVLKRPDLFPDKEEPGKGRFYNCPAGWGCQIVNDNLITAYGLKEAGFVPFNPGSGEGLAGAIAKAYERKEPFFGYYWAPTSVLGKYPMVRLGGMKHDADSWPCIIKPDCADPKPNMYPAAEVLTVVTTRFANASPAALAFVNKFSWPNKVINSLLAWKDDNQATAEETAERFFEKFGDTWQGWVPPAVAAKVKASVS